MKQSKYFSSTNALVPIFYKNTFLYHTAFILNIRKTKHIESSYTKNIIH